MENQSTVEKIALGMLGDARPTHPIVQRWIDAIIASPEEMRELGPFSATLDDETVTACLTDGWKVPHLLPDGEELDLYTYPVVGDDMRPLSADATNASPKYQREADLMRALCRIDAACVRLARCLVIYRQGHDWAEGNLSEAIIFMPVAVANAWASLADI